MPKKSKILVPPRTNEQMPVEPSIDAEAAAIMAEQGLQPDPEAAAEAERLRIRQYLNSDGPMSPEVEQALAEDIAEEVQLERQYGDRAPEAFLGEAASAATLGLSDQLLTGSGLADPEALKQIRERSPIASGAGAVTGVVAPMLTPAAALTPVAAATRIAGGAERITARALEKLAADSGRKKIAHSILAKLAPTAAAGGVEGSAISLGQLISEEALGNAEFNGQNIVASLGSGALLGTGAGAAFGALKATVPVVAKGAGAVASRGKKYFEHLADPIEAAKAQSGLSKAKIVSIEQQHPDFFAKLPSYFREQLGIVDVKGAFQTADELATRNSQAIASAGGKIGNISKKLDELTTQNPALLPTRAEAFDPMIDGIFGRIDQLTKAGVRANKKEIRVLQDFGNDLYQMKLNKQPLSFNELNELRKSYQNLAYIGKRDMARGFEGELANSLRAQLRKQVDVIADRVSSASADPVVKTLSTELRKANEVFHIGSTIEKSMLMKAGKISLLSPTEVIEAAALGHVGGPTGLIAGAVKKFARTGAAKNLAILADMKKQQAATQSRIKQALGSFVSKNAKAVRPASLQVLINSRFSDSAKGESPKNKKEAFANLRQNVNSYTTEHQKLVDRMAKATSVLAQAAPNAASEVQNTLSRAVAFLSQKMPQTDNPRQGSPWARPYEPSNFELAKFERYLQVIEAPLSVLDDLEANSLTREHVEALQAVYPAIYSEVRLAAMEAAAAKGPELPYAKRVQLSVLLDLPTDTSLEAENVLALQANFAPAEDPGAQPGIKPTQAGASKIDSANRAQTETQRVATRGQQ